MNVPLRSSSPGAASSNVNNLQLSNNCVLDDKIHRDKESWVEKGLHAKSLDKNECMECNCKVRCYKIICHRGGFFRNQGPCGCASIEGILFRVSLRVNFCNLGQSQGMCRRGIKIITDYLFF